MPDKSMEGQKPSFIEIVAGKDVAIGKEIVDRLRDEGIGLPVMSLTFESKSRVTVDRAPGEESYNVTQKTEHPTILLGLILPTVNQDGYVYFGIREAGGVFKTDYQGLKRSLDPSFNQEYLIGSDSFWEKLNEVYGHSFELTLLEDKNPEEFSEIFRASVEKARKEKELQLARRAESRTGLKGKLFGEQG